MADSSLVDKTWGPAAAHKDDVTLVFQHWIMTIIPSLVFILISPIYLRYLFQRQRLVRSGVLLWLKLAGAAGLIGLEIVNVVYWSKSSPYQTDVGIAAAVLSLMSMVFVFLTVYAEHIHCIRPSTLVSIFLSIGILLGAAKTRSYFLRSGMEEISGISIAMIVFKFALVVLEEASKRALLFNEDGLDIAREALSGFWNRSLFIWLISTLQFGFKNILSIDDLQNLPPGFGAGILFGQFTDIWRESSQDNIMSLPLACFALLGWGALAPVIPRLCYLGFSFTQPFLIRGVVIAIGAVNNLSAFTIGGYIGATAIIYFGLGVSRNYAQHLVNQQTAKIRTSLTAAIMKKIFTLDQLALRRLSALTLMSTDLNLADKGLSQFHEVWAAIVGLGVGIGVLAWFVGPAAVVVLIPAAITTYVSYLVSIKQKNAQIEWNAAIEDRVAGTSDVLNNIRSIKMSGWVDVASNFVHSKLVQEILQSKKTRKISSLVFGADGCAELLPSVVVVAATIFWTRRDKFTAEDVFGSLAVIALVSEPLSVVVNAFPRILRCLASYQRIQNFLVLKDINIDLEPPGIDETVMSLFRTSFERRDYKNSLFGVSITRASSALFENGRQLLRDISIMFGPQTLTMITGPVGCGKSTLLKMLLGESGRSEGTVVIDSTEVAYCDQTPWIRNISIKENIIGESHFSPLLYEAILYACDLLVDLDRLPGGDEFLAGSGGCNLSGGQKQRIALARAMYPQKAILILDDVFSALDKLTAAKIFRRLFGEQGVLRASHTTVILATNLIEHLSYADQVITIDGEGNVKPQVEAATIAATAPYLQHESELPEEHEDDDEVHERIRLRAANAEIRQQQPNVAGGGGPERQRGDFSLYKYYVDSFGWKLLGVWIVWTAITAAMERVPFIFIRIWLVLDPDNKLYFIGFAMCAIGAILSMMGLVAFYFLFLITKSYESLHQVLLDTVMKSTLSFISITDVGVLLNRFSQDMSLVGQDLPLTFMRLVFTFFTVLVDIGIISSGSVYTVIIIPFLLVFIYFLQNFYLRTSRQMRHLDLEAKSPLYTIVSEATAGIQHIRAFQWTEVYFERAMERLDYSMKPFYSMMCIQQWLRLVLDLAVMVVAIAIVTLALTVRSAASQAGTGLALLNLISFSFQVAFHLREWVDMETSLGAISRLRTFERDTPVEKDPELSEEELTYLETRWPSRGEIKIKHLSAWYQNDEERPRRIVDGVTFTARPGEKVGITGRTGSGKTSLVLSTLHFLEMSGDIYIDRVRLRRVPRKLLRSKITTIPQDAIEIPGAVRVNLDDSLTAPDALMIDILTRIGIWQQLEAQGGLDADMKAMNLSQGEKQLINLARAMIHHIHTGSKIAVMDEATSHIDYARDRKVQAVMEQVFADCTMLVVAHRDETIARMDTILEMSDGKLTMVDERRIYAPPGTIPGSSRSSLDTATGSFKEAHRPSFDLPVGLTRDPLTAQHPPGNADAPGIEDDGVEYMDIPIFLDIGTTDPPRHPSAGAAPPTFTPTTTATAPEPAPTTTPPTADPTTSSTGAGAAATGSSTEKP